MANVELISICGEGEPYWVIEPNIGSKYYTELERRSFVIPDGYKIEECSVGFEFYDEKNNHCELHTNTKTNQPYLIGTRENVYLKSAELIFTQIKDLRRAVNLTQQEFADYFEVSRRTLENWESGRNEPADYLIKLMEYKLRKEGILTGEVEENQE